MPGAASQEPWRDGLDRVGPYSVAATSHGCREENQRLKRLVADLTLDKTMLQDVLAKKF